MRFPFSIMFYLSYIFYTVQGCSDFILLFIRMLLLSSLLFSYLVRLIPCTPGDDLSVEFRG